MFTINGKQFRSLEEQVAYLSELHEAGKALASWGIKIVGQLESASELPIPYTGEFGDAFAVGIEAPFNFYIWTRASIAGGDAYWFPFGEISIVGPQGPQGIQGPQGEPGASNKWFTGQIFPAIASIGDMFLDSNDGQVYTYKETENGNIWIPIINITGPQGVQGIRGYQGYEGPQGPEGPQGLQGIAGQSLTIENILNNAGMLPDPNNVNRNTAYLIGESSPYDLYIILKNNENNLEWANIGSITNYLSLATLNVLNGEGNYSLVQRTGPGGTHGSSDTAPKNVSIAKGPNSAAFGVQGESLGACTLTAGYQAKALEKACIAFGTGIAGRTAQEWVNYYWDVNTWSTPHWNNVGSVQKIPNGSVPQDWENKGIVKKPGTDEYYYVLGPSNTKYGQWLLNPSFAAGQGAKAKGQWSTAFGYDSIAKDDFSFVLGQSTQSNAHHGFAGGFGSKNNSPYGFIYGLSLTSSPERNGQTIFGAWNEIDNDAQFIIAGGRDSFTRKNIFTITKDGRLKLGNTTITEEQLQQLLNLL